jgi:hypothetical protein
MYEMPERQPDSVRRQKVLMLLCKKKEDMPLFPERDESESD